MLGLEPPTVSTQNKPKLGFVYCFARLVFLLIVVKVPSVSPGASVFTPCLLFASCRV